MFITLECSGLAIKASQGDNHLYHLEYALNLCYFYTINLDITSFVLPEPLVFNNVLPSDIKEIRI